MQSGRPAETEYAPFYAGYVALVPEADVLAALVAQKGEIEALFARVPPERELSSYAEGKWTLREVLGHLVDGERIFGHRAFCVSRGELAPLPSFDQNAYVAASAYRTVPLRELVRELLAVREANLVAFSRMPDAGWERRGTVSGWAVTVRALATIMVGHVRHHAAILRQRYGLGG